MVNQLKNSSIISKRNTLKSKVVKVSLFVFKGRIKEECVQAGPLCSPVSTSVPLKPYTATTGPLVYKRFFSMQIKANIGT